MNELQHKLLEISDVYIKICEKYGFRYFAFAGTCLGAVRHGGFIPWDDDMDFAMPREDYDRFVKEAQKHFPPNYFVQIYETDKEYLYPFCKVRDSNTTMIDESLSNADINHGCWIDIFPLDGFPTNESTRRKLSKLVSHYNALIDYYYHPEEKPKAIYYKLFSLLFNKFGFIRKILYRSQMRIRTSLSYTDSNFVWSNWYIPSIFFDKEWFSEGVHLKFESIEMMVPKDYNSLLSHLYDNWEELPPINKRVPTHDINKLDLEHSYILYR